MTDRLEAPDVAAATAPAAVRTEAERPAVAPAAGDAQAAGDAPADPVPPASLGHAAALSAPEARTALIDAEAVECRRELATLERVAAAGAATRTLLALARGRPATGGLRARVAAFAGRVRGIAPGPALLVRTSGLFIDAWYASQHGTAPGGTAPFDHYLAHGMAANLAPNPFFDPAWYLAHDAEAAASGLPAILHYLRHGAPQLLAPGPLFSAIAYGARYPDTKREPDLFAYFLTKGMFEGHAAIPERVPYDD